MCSEAIGQSRLSLKTTKAEDGHPGELRCCYLAFSFLKKSPPGLSAATPGAWPRLPCPSCEAPHPFITGSCVRVSSLHYPSLPLCAPSFQQLGASHDECPVMFRVGSGSPSGWSHRKTIWNFLWSNSKGGPRTESTLLPVNLI